MKRQQTILDKLHDELLAGVSDRTKEEELWEVQRVVTTLKRKLRQMKKNDADAAAAAATAASTVEEEGSAATTGPTEVEPEQTTEPSKAEQTESSQTAEETVVEQSADVIEATPQEAINGMKDERESPTMEQGEEAQLTVAEVAAADETSEAEAVIEPEKDEDYVDMGHDEGYKALVEALLEEEQKLVLETEELNQLGEELRRKIEAEKIEIDRLKEEMEEIRLRRAQSLEDVELQQRLQQQQQQSSQSQDGIGDDVTDGQINNPTTTALTASTGSDIESNYSGGSGSESELDEEELHQLLQSLVRETDHLFREKQNITIQIETERTKCMNYKIQIRLMQWRTERLMTLQQKQDEKLLRDKPLMPVAASTFQQQQQQQQQAQSMSVAVADIDDTDAKKEPIDLKDVEKDLSISETMAADVKIEDFTDIVVVNGDLKPSDDHDVRSSPIEITKF